MESPHNSSQHRQSSQSKAVRKSTKKVSSDVVHLSDSQQKRPASPLLLTSRKSRRRRLPSPSNDVTYRPIAATSSAVRGSAPVVPACHLIPEYTPPPPRPANGLFSRKSTTRQPVTPPRAKRCHFDNAPDATNCNNTQNDDVTICVCKIINSIEKTHFIKPFHMKFINLYFIKLNRITIDPQNKSLFMNLSLRKNKMDPSKKVSRSKVLVPDTDDDSD